ncbi:hypothetical protein HY642_07475, partial [Candidatus Woesearchaeota archaeon]|nr:hypothetical protein [Candidatus Woesearchaeota archaeon]
QPDVRLKPIELANIPGIGGPGPRKHEGPLKRPAASGEPHPGEYGRPRIPRPQRARPMRRNQGPRRPQQKKEAYGFPD